MINLDIINFIEENKMKCLMLETQNNRRFFTYQGNFNQLREFAKVFSAAIYWVEVSNRKDILNLEQLAPAFCDQTYKPSTAKFKILKLKTDSPPRGRLSILQHAEHIHTFIVNKFMAKEIVSLRELKETFKNFSLSDAALCNHVRRVKQELLTRGYEIKKVGGGKYMI